MIRRFLRLAFTGIILYSIPTGCSSPKSGSDERSVTVSILPLKYFVDRISGNTLQTGVLVPPGASPETFEPSMGQLVKASESRLFIGISILGFEQAWQEQLAGLGKETVYIDVCNGMDLISGTHGGKNEEHGQHEGHNHGYDPHVWLSPDNARLIALNTYRALVLAWPHDSVSYRINYEILLQEITTTEEDIIQSVSKLKNNKFLVYHPALAYFARQFGLIQIALELDGKNPSPAWLKEVFEKVSRENLKYILVQTEIPPDRVVPAAEQLECEMLWFDPLKYDWRENMVEITRKVILAADNGKK